MVRTRDLRRRRFVRCAYVLIRLGVRDDCMIRRVESTEAFL
jgi:hypothetical protein